jgi:hypothetical protein
VKIFCPFTPQAAAGLSCAVTQEPRYDQRLISALATTQPKAVTVTVALVRAPNHRQPAEDLSRYVGGHSCNTLVRCLIVSLDLGHFVIESLEDALGLGEAAASSSGL